MKESVNIYLSSCCSVQASKPACTKILVKPKKKGGREGKTPEFSTLGKWRCGKCGQKCTVSRIKKAEVTSVGA